MIDKTNAVYLELNTTPVNKNSQSFVRFQVLTAASISKFCFKLPWWLLFLRASAKRL
jgi:hypothetical protein